MDGGWVEEWINGLMDGWMEEWVWMEDRNIEIQQYITMEQIVAHLFIHTDFAPVDMQFYCRANHILCSHKYRPIFPVPQAFFSPDLVRR